MSVKRKSIKLYEHDRQMLIDLYLRWRIPIDQYEKRPDDLQAFVEEWQKACGRTDEPQKVLHYMRTQRKRSLWVTFDDGYETAPALEELSPEQTEALVKVFHDNVTMLENGSDVLAYDQEISELLVRAFSEEVGRIFPAHVLIAKLTALRKRGLLPKVGKRSQNTDDIGFSDINQATGS